MQHDVDHLPAYLAAHDAFRGGASQLAVVEDDVGALLVPLRILGRNGGSLDAASSEVRSAPLFTDGTSIEWRREAIRELLIFLRRRGVVSLFLRFHPLLDSSAAEFSRFGAVVEHGPTFNIQLDRPLDDIRAAMSKSHRRGIRKFQAAGYDYSPDPDWEALPDFHAIYAQTMERVGASDDFRFTLDYFERLRDTLSDHVSLWTLEVDGLLAMGGIVTECGGIVQGLYGAVNAEFHGEIPQIGSYDAEVQWALARRAQNYFFDGAAYESLRRFKAGMTTHQPVSSSARIVIDPVEFGRQCAAWELVAERPVPHSDDFFPPYRRTGVTGRGERHAATVEADEPSATIRDLAGS
ncbi:GNAT family protein [Gulosibacter sp. ACHW.36C]|uniref:Aminoacyltransferase n=1 Tax=Gulosibacter sediminis TaxID=1729695 RepID=A0ABY4MV93_9MICO|nr:GNAT family N-acetyltransferase [Gulosibacter sediminis]UQN14343.1 aminoacyltransferase [Gulosibacter sediminis]